MTACSACEDEAQPIKVHGFDLCPRHASGMMTAVLTGDFTPVGYIIAASCGMDSHPTPKVSAPKPTAKTSAFMRHGALANAEPCQGASPKSGQPQPVTASTIPEFRSVRVSTNKWREHP